MSMQMFAYKFLKGLSRPSKRKKEYRYGQELQLKVKKHQEQNEKTIIELKGRAAKFHKSSLTFWAKAVSQPRNKQKPAAVTNSVDTTNLGTTSVLL